MIALPDTLDAAVLGTPERLHALSATRLVDAPPSRRLDVLVRRAAALLRAPVAYVSLVDTERQFFASSWGLPEPWATCRQTPLSHSFCKHVVLSRQPLVVSDAREHPVLRTNGAVRDLGVVAYLGVPLITAAGTALGSCCVIDTVPRTWSVADVTRLRRLADVATREIETLIARADGPSTEHDAPVGADAPPPPSPCTARSRIPHG